MTETICSYCGVGCSLELHVQDNEIVKVTSPLDHSVTHGNLCVKGRFGYQYVQNRARGGVMAVDPADALDSASRRRRVRRARRGCACSRWTAMGGGAATTASPPRSRWRSGSRSRAPSSAASRSRCARPAHDFELAAGFLFTEGLIERAGDVRAVRYCAVPREEQHYNVVSVAVTRALELDPQRNFYATSSCGICGKASLDAIDVRCAHRGRRAGGGGRS